MGVFVEDFFVHAGVEPGVVSQAVGGHQVQQVVLDLGAGGEEPVPVAFGGERELVGEGGDIGAHTGIGVAQPGPPESLVAVDDDEVVDADLTELDRGADAAHAGADDGDLVVGGRVPVRPRAGAGNRHGQII